MAQRIENIPFEKLLNTRDLGGLPAANGKTIRPKTFYRAAALYQVTPADEEKLVNVCKVAYDIDLRIEKELKSQPDPRIEGIDYRHYQLREDVMEAFQRKRGESIGKAISRIPSMPQMYINMVSKENSLEALRKIFRLFFNEVVPGEKAALFHCSEGKDRTGIVAALIEDLVGVPRDIMLEDYMLSNEAFVARNKKYYFGTRLIMSKKRADSFRNTYQANEFMLTDMFDYIEKTYGGTESFFQNTLGFTAEEIEAFKNKILQ